MPESGEKVCLQETRAGHSNSNHNGKSFSFYNWIAPFYDALMKLAAFIDGVRARRERRKFVRSLDLNPEGRVLEIGVGTGLNLPLIARQVGNGSVIVGLDYSIPMLEQSRDKAMRKRISAHLVGENAERLPLKNDFFDTVYIFGCFNSLENQGGTVREMMRVAKPNTLIVISDKSLVAYKRNGLRKKLLKLMEPDSVDSPPVDVIPIPKEKVQLRWMWKNLMYVLTFQNPDDLSGKDF